MSTQLASIQRIEEKVQRLVKQYQTLEAEHTEALAQLQAAQSKISNQATQVEQLQQQVQILKAGINQLGGEDKKQFEKQLNQYIKDIDACISILSA